MLQIDGNICAREVVCARSWQSRYLIPLFLVFHTQENSRNICKGVMRACGCIEFYKSPPVLGAPKLCRQLLPWALQRTKREHGGAAFHIEEPTQPHMQKTRLLSKSDGSLENKQTNKITFHFLIRRYFIQGNI